MIEGEQGYWVRLPATRIWEDPRIPIDWRDGETECDLGGTIVVRREPTPPQSKPV